MEARGAGKKRSRKQCGQQYVLCVRAESLENRTCCGSTDGVKYRGNSLEASTKSQAPNQRIESGCKSQHYQLLAGQPCQRSGSKRHRDDEQSCCRKTNARDCAESQHHPVAKCTTIGKLPRVSVEKRNSNACQYCFPLKQSDERQVAHRMMSFAKQGEQNQSQDSSYNPVARYHGAHESGPGEWQNGGNHRGNHGMCPPDGGTAQPMSKKRTEKLIRIYGIRGKNQRQLMSSV